MKPNKLMIGALSLATILGSCTKLNETLNSSLTNTQTANALGSQGVALLLQAAYADVGGPFTAQDLVFSLEENSTDESLVPTRGGDWDDNGVWRVVHNHTWNADHSQVLNVFNSLNKLNFDATNVLAFNPSKGQAAEARFLRALSLYYLLDLYGQYPYRNPGDNLLNAPTVKTGAEGAQFIIDELTAIMNDLPTTGGPSQATQNAAKVLLMKTYLNKGMFAKPTAPTFTDADMNQVITLGTAIINSGAYSYESEYFNNFIAGNNGGKESIFAYPNTSGVNANNSGINGRWCMTTHYNSNASKAPNAGWNGFSTIGDFYTSFGAVTPVTGVTNFANDKSGRYADTATDKRIGGRYFKGLTDVIGMKPGMLIGQQYNADGSKQKDRKGADLAFDPTIASNMMETGANLEVTGIRVVKYVPDVANGDYWGGPAGNWVQIFRYSDVVLMVAEAKMRLATPDNAGALTLINTLRAARGAAPVASLPLVNKTNVDDPKTLLAERGRELYWESVRRTDLLRFGVFNVIWQYKPSDDPKYCLFPIPSQALASNPNLKQNPGY
ncbi:MAG: RagB/SusD family nutrient uptake outer membrane protein [Bacteroidota bacterium]|nr:RagB/SusD family nutrient uptake outer membrane protein [Bacteroidota bacterium]